MPVSYHPVMQLRNASAARLFEQERQDGMNAAYECSFE